MNIKCDWTRNDLKKYLLKKRRIPNFILFTLGVLFFIYVTFYGFFENVFDNKVLVIGFVIYAIALIFFLWIVTKLYVYMKLRRNDKKTSKAYGVYEIVANEKEIVSQYGDSKVTYKWEEISRYRFSKNYFFLATSQDKLGLYFRREILKEDYEALLFYVKSRIKA